jgi:hypothetical protein
MTDAGEPKPWFRAKVEALLPEEWIGKAGALFRKTAEAIETFNDEHVHIDEKIQQAPEVGWKTLQKYSSETDLKIAQTEETKIAAELAKRTMTAKTRQEEAAADLAEVNVRMAAVQEMQGRLTFAKQLREINCIPSWDAAGKMTFLPAPPNYDWDGMTKALVGAVAPDVTGFTIQQTQ